MSTESRPVSPLRRQLARWGSRLRFGALAVGMCVGVALMLLALAGKFQPKTPSETVAHDERTVDGPLVEVRQITRPREETAVGTVRPVHEAALAAKILARVAEVHVRAGQAVAKDEVLVRLDDADLQARLRQAQAAVESAAAASDRAQADYDRAEKLRERQVLTQADFDAATAKLRSATAELERARQAVHEASVLLDFSVIRAPISGTVVDKRVEVGDMATPGAVLVTLYDPGRMQLVATVRESLALRLEVGQRIPVRMDILNYDCLAAISEIVPQSETASHSFTVKVTGPCPAGVYSGMFARIKLPLDDETLIVAPAAAVRQVGQLTMVDVVVEGHVVRRDVQLGRRFEPDVEVLSGLAPGEKLLLPKAAGTGA